MDNFIIIKDNKSQVTIKKGRFDLGVTCTALLEHFGNPNFILCCYNASSVVPCLTSGFKKQHWLTC